MKTGSYSIFSRSIDSKSLNPILKEVVTVKGEITDENQWFGESIAIIDFEGKKVD